MPPRRAHTKSRNGCLQCKQRRVKCNEIGPQCAHCMARGLTCSFVDASIRSKPAVGGGAGNRATSSLTSLSDPYPSPPKATADPVTVFQLGTSAATVDPFVSGRNLSAERKLELELMHMYSTATYKACMHNPDNAEARELWQGFVPRQAMKYDFLLLGVLALTSLHIATIIDNPSENEDASDHLPDFNSRQGSLEAMTNDSGISVASHQVAHPLFSASSLFYYHKALEYQTLAFSSFLPALDGLTPENCHAALGFSIIMIYLAVAFPRHSATVESSNFSPRSGPIEPILTLMGFLKGIHSLSAVSQEWLNAGPFGYFILEYDKLWKANTQLADPGTAAALEHLSLLNENLHGWNLLDETYKDVQSNFTANKTAILSLEKCFAQVVLGDLDPSVPRTRSEEEMWGDRGAIFAWLTLVGTDYVELLRKGDSMSLLIFLHWGVLLNYLNDFWWSRDSGKLLVKEIAGILHARGEEWEKRTQWGRKKVGLLVLGQY